MPKRKSKKYNHKKNILAQSSTRLGNLTSGDIIKFKYGGQNITDSNPLVLVLNPKLKGMLHGINLNYLSEGALKQIWKWVKIELNEDDTPEFGQDTLESFFEETVNTNKEKINLSDQKLFS